MKVYGQLEQAQLQASGTDFLGTITGLIWINGGIVKYSDGTVVRAMVSTDGSQALSNKTISGDSNTLSNIGIASLKTVLGDASKFLVRDASGVVVSLKTVPVGEVVGTSDAQTFTQKIFDDAITVKAIAEPTSPAVGYQKLFVDSTTNKWKRKDSSGNVFSVGEGGGDSSMIRMIRGGDSVLSEFSGKNATFDLGGAIGGSIVTQATDPLVDIKDYLYTSSASSQYDYWGHTFSIPVAYRGTFVAWTVSVKTGSTVLDDEFKVVFKDATNNSEITSSNYLIKASTSPQKINITVFVPLTCTSLKVGFQYLGTAAGKTLQYDNIVLTANPIVYKNLVDIGNVVYSGFTSRDAGTGRIKFATRSHNDGGLIVDDNSGNYTKFTARKACYGSVSFSGYKGGANTYIFYLEQYDSSNTLKFRIFAEDGSVVANGASFSLKMSSGDYVVVASNGGGFTNDNQTTFSIDVRSESENIMTPAMSVQENWTINQSCQNLLDRSWEVKFNLAGPGLISKNGRETTFSALTEITNVIYASNSANETRFYATQDVVVDATFAADGTPDATMFIRRYPSVGSSDYVTYGNQTQSNSYRSSTTAHFVLYAGEYFTVGGDSSVLSSTQACNLSFTARALNAKVLGLLPVPKIAYLEDQKPTSSFGGTLTAGVWTTRTLNTILGDSEIVSLSSNQFTLPAGEYYIDAWAMSSGVDQNMICIYNVTDGTTPIYGGSVISRSATNENIPAPLSGKIKITSPKVFELRHRVGATLGTYGGGYAVNFAPYELYAQVKITKYK